MDPQITFTFKLEGLLNMSDFHGHGRVCKRVLHKLTPEELLVARDPRDLTALGNDLVGRLHDLWSKSVKDYENNGEHDCIFTAIVDTHAVCPAAEKYKARADAEFHPDDCILLGLSNPETPLHGQDRFRTSKLKLYVPPSAAAVGFALTASGSVYVLQSAAIPWEEFQMRFGMGPV